LVIVGQFDASAVITDVVVPKPNETDHPSRASEPVYILSVT